MTRRPLPDFVTKEAAAKRNEYIDVEVSVHATTPKAALLSPAGCDESDAVWVPKSLMRYNQAFNAGYDMTVGIQRWVAERDGFLDTDVDDGEDYDLVD